MGRSQVRAAPPLQRIARRGHARARAAQEGRSPPHALSRSESSVRSRMAQRLWSNAAVLPLVWLVAGSTALAQDLPAGQIIDRVTCAADSSQSYALFVPSGYTPSRRWPVIFAFDPGGRGRTPVERYQAAAERYGFIVVGSNNSRNGSTEFARTLAAMTTDVAERLAVDPKRVYLAGMSGGARTASRRGACVEGRSPASSPRAPDIRTAGCARRCRFLSSPPRERKTSTIWKCASSTAR